MKCGNIGKQFLISAHNKQAALIDARFALLFVVPLSIHLKCSLTNQTRNQFFKSAQCFDTPCVCAAHADDNNGERGGSVNVTFMAAHLA